MPDLPDSIDFRNFEHYKSPDTVASAFLIQPSDLQVSSVLIESSQRSKTASIYITRTESTASYD